MKRLILASTSTVHGGSYLDYIVKPIVVLFKDVNKIIFIPYARPGGISHDAYTDNVKGVFSKLKIEVKGLHEFKNPQQGISDAKGIFTGGGNTFVLVDQLHRKDLVNILKATVNSGTPYLGTSAGSNICGLTMNTTNDMPIVYPKSFKTLGFVPFNINPHYLDPSPDSKHMGETREQRLSEFHKFNTQPVIGLREGSWLEVRGEKTILKGLLNARIFEYGKLPYEVTPQTDLSDLH